MSETTKPNASLDSLNTKSSLKVGDNEFTIFSLPKAAENLGINLNKLPYTHRILIENLLRGEDGQSVTKEQIELTARWDSKAIPTNEIAFRPARVLLQDFTGVPAVVDLAAMRDAMAEMGGDPQKINPLIPVDLVIDHSVQVDAFGTENSLPFNVKREYERNSERYLLLKWAQNAFKGMRVVPPGMGIVHQINLEYLGQTVFSGVDSEGNPALYPDTVVGTDSHTTMINGLGVVGWGVGGIEAEAAMLGQPIAMLVPQVMGVRLHGRLPEGTTGTDLVLRVTEALRERKVVGKFVEFFGAGLDALSLPARATIANMCPEYGATVGYFPIDEETLSYMKFTGRGDEAIDQVSAYAKAQQLFRTSDTEDPEYSEVLNVDLSEIEPSLAGPKRPQDRVPLSDMKMAARQDIDSYLAQGSTAGPLEVTDESAKYEIENGSVVIAAITSCTNTSNPEVMIGAGLLARNAVKKGLSTKPWVKTSLAPGSRVVTEYLNEANLTTSLNELGFTLAGYGCMTCIGNSGPLPPAIEKVVDEGQLAVAAVLSGNRNFEARVHNKVRSNYLASPPLVIAYALAGKTDIDLTTEPIGDNDHGEPIYLRDIWPSQSEINEVMNASVQKEMFQSQYSTVFDGDEKWQDLEAPTGERYDWDEWSTYARKPPFFENISRTPEGISDIEQARILAIFGNSVTTDHISPAGGIASGSPAAEYLGKNEVNEKDFNTYGSRRGNHEVMMRGTFANVRIRNSLVDIEGGWTKHVPTNETMTIWDAADRYKADNTPLIIFAGQEYGTGSSRDWAAKGPALQGVKAVVAESFERIHRSNLIGMGILPLEFVDGENVEGLGLAGDEIINIVGISDGLSPRSRLVVSITTSEGVTSDLAVLCRIDTSVELEYYKNGGILQYVLRGLLNS